MAASVLLKERKKSAKIFYKNPSDYNENTLFTQGKSVLTLFLQKVFFKQKQIISLKWVVN